MKCPHCCAEIPFAKKCPKCGRKLHYGGNTQILEHVMLGELHVRDIFSQTFKRHTRDDAFRSLTRRPLPVAEMLENWQRPWLYARLFLILLAGALVLGFAAQYILEYEPLAVISYIVGSTVIPWTMLLFVWEMDMYGNISVFELTGLLLMGGVLSIAFAIPMFGLVEMVFDLPSEYSSAWAAVAEEPAKLLVCILFICLSRRGIYGLDGLVIGAAVAAGFGFMETSQYGYQYMYKEGIEYGLSVLQNRNLCAVFSSHLLYTAPAVAALGLAADGERLKLRHFLDWRFWLALAAGMGCHALNNFEYPSALDFLYVPLLSIGDAELYLLMVLIAAIAWPVFLLVLKACIRQALRVNEDGKTAAFLQVKSECAKPAKQTLMCSCGTLAGLTFSLSSGNTVIIGRSRSCQLILETKSVSAEHCRLSLGEKGLVLRDMGSANGTWVNRRRIAIQQDVWLKQGDRIEIGSAAECIEVC